MEDIYSVEKMLAFMASGTNRLLMPQLVIWNKYIEWTIFWAF